MTEPASDCSLCPRLAAFRADNRNANPDWHNGPVPAFGGLDARLLIVGLAPGLKGANRTGRPFTGDHAGDLLYPALIKAGLARGIYGRTADDGLELVDCRITNAVRCVPPKNMPIGSEKTACRPFLVDEIAAMKNLAVILALGGLSHGVTLQTFGLKQAHAKFRHARRCELPGGLVMIDSYHCSRYNTNTGRLTEDMFDDVLRLVTEQMKG